MPSFACYVMLIFQINKTYRMSKIKMIKVVQVMKLSKKDRN